MATRRRMPKPRRTSRDAASLRENSRFRRVDGHWVYLDAEHWYESVRADIARWAPKVRSGGLVMGDDYGARGYWGGGVTRAVDEFVAAGGCDVVLLEANQFALRLNESWPRSSN